MSKAGGIIGIIAGIFGFIAAIVTLFVGGLGSAFEAEGANTVVGLGWGGVGFSFLAIVFGAVAIARPKGAGIGLIIVSILGAILGGTLVAICMVLSLIGGILSVAGAKKGTPAVSDASQITDTSPKKKGVWGWVLAGVGVLIVGLVVIGGQGTTKPKEDALAELANAQPSSLRPEGELSELFALGSKNTDLQRENKLKEIKGQVVEWQLPVYEVSRSGDGYKVQTETGVRIGPFGQDLVGTFIHVTPRDDGERKIIENLKTGDAILFKGRIAGSSLRSLDIKPAILALQKASVPPSVSANAQTQVTNAPPELQVPQQVTTSPAAQTTEPQAAVGQADLCEGISMADAPELLECLDKKFAIADGQLNVAYKQLMATRDEATKAALKKEQIAWIKDKEKTCAEAGKEFEDLPRGAILISNCKVQMTEERVAYLKREFKFEVQF